VKTPTSKYSTSLNVLDLDLNPQVKFLWRAIKKRYGDEITSFSYLQTVGGEEIGKRLVIFENLTSYFLFFNSKMEQIEGVHKIYAGEAFTCTNVVHKQGSSQQLISALGADQILFVRKKEKLFQLTTPLQRARRRGDCDCQEFFSCTKHGSSSTIIWNHSHSFESSNDLVYHKSGGSKEAQALIQAGYDQNRAPSEIKESIRKVKSF